MSVDVWFNIDLCAYHWLEGSCGTNNDKTICYLLSYFYIFSMWNVFIVIIIYFSDQEERHRLEARLFHFT